MYEWDNNKNENNITKHGIDFIDAKEIWQGVVVEVFSPQTQHNEKRIIAIGLYKRRYITVIYTWREENKRLISARKARKNEQEYYKNEIRREFGEKSN